MVCPHHKVGRGKDLPVPFLWQPYTDYFSAGLVLGLNIELPVILIFPE